MRALSLPLALLLAATATARPPEPIVELRIRPIDDVIKLSEYFAGLANQPAMGQQVAALANAFTKQKTGLEGIDRARPIGAYAFTAANGQPGFAVIVPIKDKAMFLQLLERRASIKLDERDGGEYLLTIPDVPVPVYLAFHAETAYIAPLSPEWVAAENRIEPKAFFAKPLAENALASLAISGDKVSEDTKAAFIAQIELRAADTEAEGRNENEPEAAFAGRVLGQRLALNAITALVRDTKSATLDLVVDPVGDNLTLDLNVTPVPSSPMAEYVRSLGQLKGHAIPMKKTDVMAAQVNLRLPPEALKDWNKALAIATDPNKDVRLSEDAKQFNEVVFGALRPTIYSGRLDTALTLGGPDARVLKSQVAVEQSDKVDSVMRQLLGQAPKAELAVKLDAVKAQGVSLHQLTIVKDDAPFKNENPYHVGTGAGQLVFGNAAPAEIAALASALARPLPVVTIAASPSGLIAIGNDETQRQNAAEAAKQVFGDTPAVRPDEVRLAVTAGNTFRVKLTAKGNAVRFAAAQSKLEEGSK